MSEEINNVAPETVPSETPVAAPAQEKLYTNDEVNQIVGRKKAEAADKARREMESKYKQAEQPINTRIMSNEELLKKATDMAHERMMNEVSMHKKQVEEARMQAQFDKDAQNFVNHIKGVEISPEEDECELFSKPEQYSALALMAGNLNLDNTGEIMKELARNPHKLMTANAAAKEGNMAAFKAQFKRISNSIKQNEKALEDRPNVKAPLTQMKSSSMGSGSGDHNTSVSDFRSADWLRG